jgi:hypothetical protein
MILNNNQSPMLTPKLNMLQSNSSSPEKNQNDSANEMLGSVQDIIEHFQQYSKRNSNNQSSYNINSNNNNNSELSSPNVNVIIQNLNNSSANVQQKIQQTNFAAIAFRPASAINVRFFLVKQYQFQKRFSQNSVSFFHLHL